MALPILRRYQNGIVIADLPIWMTDDCLTWNDRCGKCRGILTYQYRSDRGNYIFQISLRHRLVHVVSPAEWRGIEIDPTSVAVSALHENDDAQMISKMTYFLRLLPMYKSDIFSTLNGRYSFLNGIPSISLDICCYMYVGPTECCFNWNNIEMIFETQIMNSLMHSNLIINVWHRIDKETHSVVTWSLWGEPIGHSDDSTDKGPVMRSVDALFVVSPNKAVEQTTELSVHVFGMSWRSYDVTVLTMLQNAIAQMTD